MLPRVNVGLQVEKEMGKQVPVFNKGGHNHGSIKTMARKERGQRVNCVNLRGTNQFARAFTWVWRAIVPGGIRESGAQRLNLQ